MVLNPLTYNNKRFLIWVLINLFCLEVNASSYNRLDLPIMADTICTNTFRDTFTTFSAEKATSYRWNLPNGASLVSQPTDTTAIINWRNATLGLHQLCVIAENSCGESQSICIDVFIQHCNAPPIANDDVQSTFHEIPITIFVQNNDTQTDGDDLSTLLDAGFLPIHGSLDLIGGAIQYTPEDAFTGVDSFQYIICDSGFPSRCDTASVHITIDHQAPVASNDLINTPSNTAIAIPVLNNDSDPEGSALTASIDTASVPFNGMIEVIDQEIVYTPSEGFTGTDRFEYIVCDSNTPQKCDRATVTVIVLNETPVATDDEVKVAAETTTILPLLGNDMDKEDGNLTITLNNSKMPINGTVTTNGLEVSYTPNAGFTGTDSLDYIICDDGDPVLCDTATVSIQVINDAPIANDDLVVVPSNSEITIEVLDNDLDLEDGMLTVLLHPMDTATQGIVTLMDNQITYIPDPNYTGEDTLQYYICDDGSPIQCDTATVFITIDNFPPTATPDDLGTTSGEPVCYPVLANDSDEESGMLVLSLDPNKPANNGLVVLENEEICYTPDAGFSGLDSLCYIICDNGSPVKCDTALLLITVENQAPIAKDDLVTTKSNEPICIAILENDEDAENGSLSFTLDIGKLPQNGNVRIEEEEICYTPNDNFSGIDTLCYIICDDGIPSKCDTAQISIIVDNELPIAINDIGITNSGEESCFDVLANDLDEENGILTLTIDTSKLPLNGTAIIKDNEICFQPNDGFSGLDSLCYIICDDGVPTKCDTAVLYIAIDNQVPMANDDLIDGVSGVVVEIAILENDSDPENTPLIISLDTTSLPTNGMVVITNNTIEYVSDTGFTGMDSLDYIICDTGDPSLCDTATIFINIINQAPDAMDDEVVVSSDEPFCIEVLANDNDPEFGLVTVFIDATKLPKNGTVTTINDEICYTSNEDFSGIDSLCYVICDDGNPRQCDTARITITVLNIAPTAADDLVDINSDEAICIEVLANDQDAENGELTVTLDPNKLPQNGQVTIEGNKICYVPNEGFSGLDSLCYIVCDNGVPPQCDTATIIITVQNQMPIAVDDFAEGVSGEELEIMVGLNDLDAENGTITFSEDATSLPANGTIELLGDLYIYTPNEGFTGMDEFDYILCDNGSPVLCDTATVFITILNQAPIAIADMVMTPSDEAITIPILQNDSDLEEGELSISVNPTSLPTSGSLLIENDSIIYTPFKGFNGDDAFEYIICDDGIPTLCDTALVTILVVNDAPIAIDDEFITNSNTPIEVVIIDNDFDPENGTLDIGLEVNSLPINGSVVQQGDEFTYTPNANFTGLDTFDYIICDDGQPSQCDTAMVTITIDNYAPTAEPDIVTTIFETPISIPYISNDSDPEGGNLTVLDSPEILPTNGTVTVENNELIYTPNLGFTGRDEFSYLLCDDGIPVRCDTALITILVPNTKPIAIDDHITLPCIPFVMIGVLGNDRDAEHVQFDLSLERENLPRNGTAEIIGDSIRYEPDFLFVGLDSFDYIICDIGTPILCDTATVFIRVNNDPPIAINDTFQIVEDQVLIGNIQSNDSDPNDHPIIVLDTLLEAPTLGILVLQPDGRFQYIPYASTFGMEEFTYILCDSVLPSACDTAMVFIEILSIPDKPLALDDINITLKDTPVEGEILTNDSDPDGDDLFVNPVLIQLPSNGEVLLDIDGTYEYIPLDGFIGEDLFVYEVCDDATPSQCDTASVQIIVTEEKSLVNRPPLGVNDYLQSTINSMVINNVLFNDADPDGDIIAINARPFVNPSSGNLELSSDGSFTYQPEKDFTGVVRFEYILFDLATPSLMDTALVSIEILPAASNSVFAVDDAFLGKEDLTITSNILSNDFDPESDVLTLATTPIQLPNEGSLILQEDGTFIYAPNKDYFGADYFIYEVCDDGLEMVCDEATVVLNILPVNDTLCTSNLPIPTIVANKTVCINDTVHLFSASPYPPIILEEADTTYSFIWLNGNGDTLAVTSESEIKFSAADSLAIPPFSMKAQRGICSSGFSNFLNVDIVNLSSPTINSNTSNTTICNQESIILNAAMLPNVQYAWTVKDSLNILSTGRELAISDLDSTTTFELTVTSEICELSTIADVTVNVLYKPEVTIELANSSAICSGSTIELIASTDSLSAYQYLWTGPNNYFSTANSPIIRNASLANNGTYQLVVEDEMGCQSNTAYLEITTIQKEVASPTIIGSTEFCAAGMIALELLEFYDSTSTFEWVNSNGITIGTTSMLSISANDSLAIAPFRVSLIQEGCTSSFSAPYSIKTFQSAVAQITTTQNAICRGSTISLTAKSFENANYEWRRVGNNTLFSTESTTILANIQNEVAIELTVFQEACPSFISKDTLRLSIESNNNLQPTATLNLNDDCSPTNLILNANIPSTFQQVNWTGPNGFASSLPVVTIGNATEEYNGTYQVSLTDSLGCTSTATLLINDIQRTVKTPVITSVEGAVCENSNILLEAPSYEGNLVQYAWFENGVLIFESPTNRLFVDDAKLNTVYDLTIKVDGCILNAATFTPIILEKPSLVIEEVPSLLCTTGEENITIQTTITGGQTPYNLAWKGPADFNSSIASPTIINASSIKAGTYTLSISDQNNCQVVASTEIDIQEGIPTPIIQQEGGSCIGDAVLLSATDYKGLAVEYEWQFPENIGVASISSPNINIPTSNENYNGSYQVTATAGGCVVQSETFELTLSSRPIINPAAQYEATANCEASDLNIFANEEGDGLTFEWIGPNGFQSSIANPIIVAATPSNNGIYELTVTSPEGCVVTKATSLVNQINSSQIKPVLQTEGFACAGELITIKAPIYQGESVNYNWLLNGALLSNEDTNELRIEATSSDNDEYQLLVQVDGCMLTSDLYTPKIIPLPTIANITKSAVYCEGETVFLTAQSSSPTGQEIEYTWRGPTGFEYINTTNTDSFNLTLPSITNIQTGSYSLSLRVGDCLSETNSVIVSIQPGLVAPSLIVEEAAICAGNRLIFTATSTASTTVQYEWYLKNDNADLTLVETTTSPTLTINNATASSSGDYSVRTINENCTSNFSNTQSILVFDVDTDLTPLSTATEIQPGCYGDHIQLSVPFYPNATYNWHGPAGFGSDRYNPVIENAMELDEGEYFVIVKMEGCQEIISNSISVKINPKPIPPIISSNSPICKGENLSFEISNAANFGASMTYEWFNAKDVLIANTNEPIRNFSNVPTEFSNAYYAVAINNGCASEPSNSMEISITATEDLVANAGIDQQFCAISSVELKASEPMTGIGEWRSLNSATIEDKLSAATTSQNLIEGSNLFIWTVSDPVCGGSIADTVEVFIGASTQDQAIAGIDRQVCEFSSIALDATPLVESEGRWTQSSDQMLEGVIITSPSSPTTKISGLTPGNTYRFTWTISQNDCPSFESDEVTIEVNDIPNERAIIPLESLSLCEGNETLIEAKFPILSEGSWSILANNNPDATPSPTTPLIASPTSANTFIEGLPTGENTLVWSLSNGACINFSTDTLRIFSEGYLRANGDEYTINFNDSIVVDIFENDVIENREDLQFIITRYPEFGTINESPTGEIIYTPALNYFGRDFFRYKLCATNCEEQCDTAIVNIAISGVEGSGACFIPNTISPNNDGNNDVFLVSCLDDFPDNQLSIFNRWGDKVFESAPYKNNWQGEFERQPLPAGTYFYALKLTREGEPLQGFITLFR